jgi:hypothetical protein
MFEPGATTASAGSEIICNGVAARAAVRRPERTRIRSIGGADFLIGANIFISITRSLAELIPTLSGPLVRLAIVRNAQQNQRFGEKDEGLAL